MQAGELGWQEPGGVRKETQSAAAGKEHSHAPVRAGSAGSCDTAGSCRAARQNGPAGHQAEPESVEYKGGRCLGLYYAKECQQARNGDTFPLSSISEATPGALHPVLGFSAQEKGTGHTGVLRRVRKAMKELEHLTHKEG